MYSSPFEYHAPATMAEALALLEKHGEEAKILTGGQSLVPVMKLRLAAPSHLVDLRKVPGLTGIRESGGNLQIGGMSTHDTVGNSPLVKQKLPMAAEAAMLIGDRQVRNLGTIGGSIAHADPSADWPAVMMALDASVVIAGPKGERTQKLSDFIVGPLTTTLAGGEILTQINVPLPGPKAGGAYEKMPHPASRFAIVGVAAEISLGANGSIAWARIAITGLAPKVTRATAVEQALQGKKADAAKAAAAHATDGMELRDDPTGSPAYRANLAAIYCERAIIRALARAAAK
jgi:carbon-monoxide dehydrogenase medium subunit